MTAAGLDAHFNTLVFDYARCKSDKDLKKCLTEVQKKSKTPKPLESIQFSDEVIKINRKKDRQMRCLLITDQAIYNFKPRKYKEFQRRIGFEDLQCVVLSKNSDEMVFQVSNEHDYRFVVPRKADALTMLHRGYEAVHTATKKKLELVYSDEKELDDFVVTKSMIANTKTKEINAKLAAAGAAAAASAASGSGTSAAAGSGGSGGGGGSALTSPTNAAAAKQPSPTTKPVTPATSPTANGADSKSSPPMGALASQSGQFPAVKRSSGEKGGLARSSVRASTVVTTSGSGGLLGLKNGGSGSGSAASPAGPQFWFVEGWLTKQAGSSLTTKWERRYCVLDENQISYYFPKIKGQLSLPGCRVVNTGGAGLALPQSSALGSDAAALVSHALAQRAAANREAQMFPFTVCYDKDKKFEVAAETEADLARWTAAFESYGPGKDKKDQIEHEGWLLKRDPTTKQMRRRYVIIIGQKCWYFEMVQKGEIEIAGGASAFETKEVEPTEQKSSELWLQSASRFSHRFNIGASMGSRVYHMAADTNEEMRQWIQALEHNNKVRRQQPAAATTNGGTPTAAAAATAASADAKDKAEAGGVNNKRGSGKNQMPAAVIDSITEEAPTGQVTFVFTDVQSSTTLWEKCPDAMDIALAQHDQILRQLLKKYRGYEVKTEGDAFMVTFWNVLDAILWCLAVQEALCKATWPEPLLKLSSASMLVASGTTIFNGIRIRMGIHTGQPNCRKNPLHGRMDYFGPVVNRSARVSDTAHGGQVVMTQECYDVLHSDTVKADERLKEAPFPLTEDLGCHKLKGVPEDVKIWQILPHSLRQRTYPPLRTINNEKKARAEKRARGEQVDTESEDDDPDTAAKPATPAAAPASKPLPSLPPSAAAASKPKSTDFAAPPPPPPADDDHPPPPPSD